MGRTTLYLVSAALCVHHAGQKSVAGNTVYNNRGNGLWLDVHTQDQALVIRDNRVHHNDASGIRSEVTDDDVRIYDNVVWENGWGRSGSKEAGISVNASQDNHVYNNIVAWNKRDRSLCGGMWRSGRRPART